MNTFEELNKYLPIIKKEFPNINRGGCGFSALMIGQELEKRGLKIKYVLVSDIKDDLPDTKTAFKKFSELHYKKKNTALRTWKNGFNICHIMVYYKGLVIDADGVASWENSCWNTSDTIISAILTPDLIRRWVSRPKGWNIHFNRKHLPLIRKRIKYVFKIIYNENKVYCNEEYGY